MQFKEKLRPFILLLVVLGLLSGCSNGFQADTNWKVQDFNYTNQNNKKVSLKDLKGDIWLADFVFTSCATVCPPMTKNLTKIQKQLENDGVRDIRFVSFSVDPDVDTPKKMKDYISLYDANQEQWDWLTGYTQEEISQFAKKSFKTLVQDDPSSNQVIHGTSFYLVNKEGVVVKNYSGMQDVPFDQIVKDIKALKKSYE